jgi:adenylate cyclase
MAHYRLGSVLRRAGRTKEAIPHFDHAMRLSPRDIWITGMLTDRAFVLFDLERYDEALEWARRARLSPNPRTMTFAVFAAVLVRLERLDEARGVVNDLLAHAPGLSYTKYRENLFGTPEVMERLAAALREAGLPE